MAAAAGADFLCYVTPAEHLGLPTDDDVREGLIASKIAAHAGDIVKGVPGALERDLALARARKALDWETQRRLSIDPVKFAAVRKRRRTRSQGLLHVRRFLRHAHRRPIPRLREEDR